MLNKNVPDLNQRICDRHGDPCDEFCGGAGCKNGCGGLRCENGALTLSEKALDFAKKTEQNIKEKEELADDIIRSMSQAKANASESYKKAKKTHDETQAHLEETKKLIDRSNVLVANLTDMIENTTASPGEMRALIEQVMSHTLQLDPDQIDDLAQKIQDAVSHLVNVEAIIRNTETDLRRVEMLKADAVDKKDRAEKVFSGVLNITKALDDADDAQKKARQSIKQANADIASAKIDLEEIEKETDDAQKRANTTANAVLTLQSRLEQLQKDNILNEHGAQEINNQAEVVKESANNAHERATQLKNDFKTANESLTVQARKSESARERAQNLLNRASKITVDTNTQLAELQTMDEVYKSNEKEIQTLEAELNDLTEKVSGYLEAIRTKAELYRTC